MIAEPVARINERKGWGSIRGSISSILQRDGKIRAVKNLKGKTLERGSNLTWIGRATKKVPREELGHGNTGHGGSRD